MAPPYRAGRVEAHVYAKRLTGSPEPWIEVAAFSAEPDEVVSTTRDVLDEVSVACVGCVVRVVRRKQVLDWYVPAEGSRVRIPLAREYWIGSGAEPGVVGGADWLTAWWESAFALGMLHALAKLDRRTAVGVLCDVALSVVSRLRERRVAEYVLGEMETRLLTTMERVYRETDVSWPAIIPIRETDRRDARALSVVAFDLERAASMIPEQSWALWWGSFSPNVLEMDLHTAAGKRPPLDLPGAMRARLPMDRLVALFRQNARRIR